MESLYPQQPAGEALSGGWQPGNAVASWPAIIAGAFVAAAVTVVLFALGSGLGFASISPWQGRGMGATAFVMTGAIWLIVTQWIAAGMGGYIAGRLRSRWIGTHTHEVFFRDTAHGFVTWAVASVLVALLVSSSLSSAVGGGVRATASVASGAAQAMTSAASSSSGTYDLDSLFRPKDAGHQPAGDARAEVTHILANAVATGAVPDADRTYMASLVAAQAGIPQDEAQKRVDDIISKAAQAEAKAKAAADTARRDAAKTLLFIAFSMLIGAFIACVAAALGGHLRDQHP
jgi:hypothetical protein